MEKRNISLRICGSLLFVISFLFLGALFAAFWILGEEINKSAKIAALLSSFFTTITLITSGFFVINKRTFSIKMRKRFLLSALIILLLLLILYWIPLAFILIMFSHWAENWEPVVLPLLPAVFTIISVIVIILSLRRLSQ